MSDGVTRKTSKWVIGGLVLSIALNLFLGTYLVSRWRQPDPFSIFPKIPVHKLMKSLPEDQRDEVEVLWRARKPELHKQFRAMREAQVRLQEVLKAETPDRVALDNAFDDLRAVRSQLEHTMQGAFVDVIMILPPDARQELSMRWYRPKGKHKHDGPPKDRDDGYKDRDD